MQDKVAMKEIIYVLINEAMLGYVKVGRTGNLEQRIRSLDTSGIGALAQTAEHMH
jgi:hypothetical protein